MSARNERVGINTVRGHLAPLCRHGTKEAKGGKCAKERDKDELLPFVQQEAEDPLHGRRYADDVEAAELAKIEHKGARNTTGRMDATTMWR